MFTLPAVYTKNLRKGKVGVRRQGRLVPLIRRENQWWPGWLHYSLVSLFG